MSVKILRIQQVAQQTGLSHSSIYKQIRLGLFPRPIKLTARASGWEESAVQAWIVERSSPMLRSVAMTASQHNMWHLLDTFAGVFELRGIKNGQPTKTSLISWRHYPPDTDLAAMLDDFERIAMDWDAAGYNVYAVLNEIDEDFRGTSAKDIDIDARRYILIDIDRAAKADCPASDEEIQHAVDLSDLIKKCMSRFGWLEPLVVMSGNGVHLYYY